MDAQGKRVVVGRGGANNVQLLDPEPGFAEQRVIDAAQAVEDRAKHIETKWVRKAVNRRYPIETQLATLRKGTPQEIAQMNAYIDQCEAVGKAEAARIRAGDALRPRKELPWPEPPK